MSAARDFRGAYSPGGLTARALRRERARMAGIASGKARKRLSTAKPRRRCRSRGQALALTYSHRQLTRSQFDALYERRWPRPEHPPAAVAWQRGRETLWLEYALTWRLYRRRGQHCGTTNAQRAAALAARSRPRHRRTVQRLHRRLEVLGLIVYSHDRRGGAAPGNKDRLVVEIRTPLSQHVTPPAGARTSGYAGEVRALPATSPCADKTGRRPPDGSVRAALPPDCADGAGALPPDGGDQRQAASPPASEREQIEAQIRFQELKLACGWRQPQIQLRLFELRARLRALEATPEPEPAPSPHEDSGDPRT